jgi:phosphoenolpyruvate carboxykinase (GTP)
VTGLPKVAKFPPIQTPASALQSSNVQSLHQSGITLGKTHDEAKLPKIFYVNWFRRDADGGFLWPGYGENSRVIKWGIEQVDGKISSEPSPVGLVPIKGALDTEGLELPADQIQAALLIDKEEWLQEIPHIKEWFATIGEKLPSELKEELATLESNLQ